MNTFGLARVKLPPIKYAEHWSGPRRTPAERTSAGLDSCCGGVDPLRGCYYSFIGKDARKAADAWRRKYPDHREYKETGADAFGEENSDAFEYRIYYIRTGGYSIRDKEIDDYNFNRSKF